MNCLLTGDIFNWVLPGHIATTGYNLVIIEEPTATEVASVSRKFPADPNIAFASFQATGKIKIIKFNRILLLALILNYV